jgi:hypothetical protein
MFLRLSRCYCTFYTNIYLKTTYTFLEILLHTSFQDSKSNGTDAAATIQICVATNGKALISVYNKNVPTNAPSLLTLINIPPHMLRRCKSPSSEGRLV